MTNQSVWCSFSWGRAHVRPGQAAKHPAVVIRAFCILAQHRPNAPFRSDMAAAWAPFPPNLDPLGPNFGSRANVADSMRRAENIHFWLLLPTFFALHGGSCKVMLPRLGLSGPPTQDQVAHVKPNLRPNVRKLRHVGPQLLEPDAKFSASSAQVRLNLRPRTAKLDPSQLWLGQVGLLLSPLSYSLGASRSDSKINMVDSQFLTDFAA